MASIRVSQLLSLPTSLRVLTLERAVAPPTLHISASAPCGGRHLSTTNSNRTDANAAPNNSSVNDAEVSHFNALASSWWDPHGSSRLLHLMNPLRHKFIWQCTRSDIPNTSSNKRYLDIGCGGGIFAESAARLPDTETVTAIDPSPEVLAVARRHQRQDPLLLENGRLNYHITAIEHLPLPDSPAAGYDFITLFEVVEHIKKPSPFLESCLKHLKPGGWLIGSTIARTNVSWFTTKVMAEDVLRLVPRGTHEWNQYIQPNELREWARIQPELDVAMHGWKVMGVVYVPGLGWKEVSGSEDWGNYFFGMRKKDMEE